MSDQIEKYRPKASTAVRTNKYKSSQEIIQKYRPTAQKFLILFDATGSMVPYWNETIRSIDTIIARLFSVAKQTPLSLKVVAYRDQDYEPDLVLESSPWSFSAKELVDFLKKIRPIGGGDIPESVDLALDAAIKEEGVSRIILIGDAPPHEDRDCQRQARQLGQRNIPVYSILVGDDSEAEESFRRISDLTGGRILRLENLEDLFEFITIVFVAGLGERTLEEYVSKYPALSQGAKNLVKQLSEGSAVRGKSR